MAKTRPLGKLESVDLRDYWEREDTDFTPWLASPENIDLLGDAIGMDLDLQEQEVRVGPFRADILCRDTVTDRFVLIENQLERTDHGHLGQLLTYAAGLEAAAVVWIASRFTNEHRAALDWLNRVTHEELSFFGIQIELYRIGGSAAAPKFEVVSKPNDWAKSVKEATAGALVPTETRQLQIEYWQAFGEVLAATGLRTRPVKPQPTNWLHHGFGRAGIPLVAYVNVRDKQVALGLIFTGEHAATNYRLMERERAAIESELGFPLEWDFRDDRKEQKLTVRKPADPSDRNSWPELHAWTVQKMRDFERVLAPRARVLDPTALDVESTLEPA